jgi:hypothetical protein
MSRAVSTSDLRIRRDMLKLFGAMPSLTLAVRVQRNRANATEPWLVGGAMFLNMYTHTQREDRHMMLV